MHPFTLHAGYVPMGDQPCAIDTLTQSLLAGHTHQTLLGVTGSGKTFTMANIIARLQRPTLIIAHNKTLAAQLAQEFREFFPDNAVHYFVSYYDYYQPEAYISKTDTYIEKESTINEEIDRLRHATTESLLTRRDVIIVASVSCIYGIGEVEEYRSHACTLVVGEVVFQDLLIERFLGMQFRRTNVDFVSGTFRVMGDTIDIFPVSSENYLSISFFGDAIETITRKQTITNRILEDIPSVEIFPAKHFVTTSTTIAEVVPQIRHELNERIEFFKSTGNLLCAERIKMRVEYDLEMLTEVGYVNGIENYSRYLSRREAGTAPTTLIDFFPRDFLTFIDESHMTVPQVHGMYAGDRARKTSLIDNGFRMPSAYDNRPLQYHEFAQRLGQTVYVSATPAQYEQDISSVIAQQIIRPTGLLDPEIFIEDMTVVADSLLSHLRTVRERNERALITTLTKRSSEELAEFLASNGVKVQYLHSEVETIERLEILRSLRLGDIETIVGVNLLREGLDLPEVSFIGILDADKVGFLRSTSSLLQIIGRAARNSEGKVVMYGSHVGEGIRISAAMREAMDITERRRSVQHAHNIEYGITPTTITSSIKSLELKGKKTDGSTIPKTDTKKYLARLELDMDIASANLQFEEAARLRDEILALKGEIRGKKKR